MIKEAERKTGRDAMEIIFEAMRMLVHDYKTLRNILRTVEYQKRVDEETGEPIVKRRVKVKMCKLEHVLFQDMRRCFLKSVSLLVAIAIKTYLSRVVAFFLAKCSKDVEDNYPGANYAHKEKCAGEAICVTIWWGVPPNIEELLPF